MRLSDQIEAVCASPEGVTLRKFLEATGKRGPALALALVCVVIILPLPVVGVFGLVAFPLAVELAFPRLIRIPARLLDHPFRVSADSRGVQAALRALRAAERALRPRWPFFIQRRRARAVTLTLMLLCSMSALVPFPGTNAVPACGMLLMCLGILEDDGLFIAAGWAVSVLGLALASAILYAAYYFGDRAFDVLWGRLVP